MIVSRSLDDAATDVGTAINIVVEFNEPLDPATLTPASFAVSQGAARVAAYGSHASTTRLEGPTVATTLTPIFARLLDRDALLLEARRLGAVKRDRMLHVSDVLLAMVRCAVGDEHRSVATARRQFFDLTGVMPEESSFYDRLTPALADLAWQTFLRMLAGANRVQRKVVANALGVHVRDVRVVDTSVVTLPKRAAAHFPWPTPSTAGSRSRRRSACSKTCWSMRTSPTRVATIARRSRTDGKTGPSGLFMLYADTLVTAKVTANGSTRNVTLGATDQLVAGAMIVMP